MQTLDATSQFDTPVVIAHRDMLKCTQPISVYAWLESPVIPFFIVLLWSLYWLHLSIPVKHDLYTLISTLPHICPRQPIRRTLTSPTSSKNSSGESGSGSGSGSASRTAADSICTIDSTTGSVIKIP
jgi:hypothetical protein